MEPLVYSYTDSRQYLGDYYDRIKKEHPLFSLRAWARQMGFKGHTSLSFLLSGQRPIRPIHVGKIVKGLKLKNDEESYFRNLVHFESAETAEKKDFYRIQMELLHPGKDFIFLETERFRLVADWFHMAILEMTRLKGFQGTAEWIARKLFFAVPVDKVSEALIRLKNLKLLKDDNGTLVKTNERLTTPRDRASESIREHHKQVLKNAMLAIDEQSVDERFFNSFALTTDISTLPEAKELIRKFREDLSKLMEKNPGDSTYQVSFQLFRLTKSEHHSAEKV